MHSVDYTSVYARCSLRSTAREALMVPITFARWGREALTQQAEMVTWSARQWIAAFLLDRTDARWIVAASSLDLADMPRHVASRPMLPDEHATSDPVLPVPQWTMDLIFGDVNGALVVEFISTEIFQSKHAPPLDIQTKLTFEARRRRGF